MRRKCRIWWPKQLSVSETPTDGLLFGWSFCQSSVSVDFVVAFVSDKGSLPNFRSRLQDRIHEANENLPSQLRDKATFTILGHYGTCRNENGELSKIIADEDSQSMIVGEGGPCAFTGLNCGCHGIDGLVEDLRQYSMSSYWIHMVYDSSEHSDRKLRSSPRLHHIHWNREIVSQCDVHVIYYETPVYGSHHFALSLWSSTQAKTPLKKPKWVDEVQRQQPLCDIEIVILSINCASAVKIWYERCIQLEASVQNSSISYMIFSLASQLLATILASTSTLYYGFIQFFYFLSSIPFFYWMHITSERVLKNTWTNLRIRSCQILYWPILLQENDMRSRYCVEHAEKAVLQRHAMWSALAVDVVSGILMGLGLLFHTDSICLWIFNFTKEFTNGILRSGCVWLMGVPAGFKLNTELAGVLSMVSLNVIQIWSTLWVFMASFIFCAIRLLALVGITFGTTVAAALVTDIITFATLHISVLHQTIAFLYSHQIEALAALWRLFRGRKSNPLRQRLDSYGYTVKQHVVGSLLFTPLLLLLPTTSVFFVFFTILNTAINSICMLIEITISVIHSTPYTKVIVWLIWRRRFPSGISFEIEDKIFSSSNDVSEKKSLLLVSTLHSNYLTIGQILMPHYKMIFSGISGSSLAASASGILTGKRMPSKLGLGLPPTMPWMHMTCREYWIRCRDSIISSIKNDDV
ncbi:PREDICTED: uncharacterized protein LOC104824423 isoform X2 [Tarenaya hassleriana]|uniref:uncharacterized protein LOC104824423 isoform X2 n=1 Tax=Tarenaya hassleriana TaxID=28532 RepID=UPI00053C4031|nr:PREDICTED: uncharacterized protein LOC104824423 isoform X2 [Tarenaya hassleriana]